MRMRLAILVALATGCDMYTASTNDDFFALFGDGLAAAANGNSTARLGVNGIPAPDTQYFNSTVACERGELQIVTTVTTNINPQTASGYIDVNATAQTVASPATNDRGCVVDGTDIVGYIQMVASDTVTGGSSIPPVFMVTGAWSAAGCDCTVELSVSAAQGWNGQVCGAPVVNSTIAGDPSC
jgi:hypothetical protein